MPTGLGGPNLEFPRRLELVGRSIYEPEIVMEPEPSRRHALGWLFRLAVLIIVVGGAGFGLLLVLNPDLNLEAPPFAEPGTHGVASAPTAGNPSVQQAPEPRLVVRDRRAYLNEPILLGLSLEGAQGGEFLRLKGLEAATRLSSGRLVEPESWQVSAFDIGNLFAYPPKDYIGTMNAVVDLHTRDERIVDSYPVRLEWIKTTLGSSTSTAPAEPDRSPAPQSPVTTLKLQPDELAVLVRRGQEMLKVGDIPAARMMLRRAANGGDAEAALILASTFDPIVIREMGVVGLAPDLTEALAWYRKASALGSREAQQRISRLESASKR
jgi:hypothetical protein